MLLKRFYDTKLAQASYLVGCQRTGEALIIDPNRDVASYLEAVKAEGMKLAFVTETHIHADFVSGSRELAQASGAKLILSGEGGPDWLYAFAAEPNVIVATDGMHFNVGNIRFDVLHTPGHTPEHLSFMITDGAATDRPMGVFTGDFIFVGDVGRPDLLEKAAGVSGTMEASARALYVSLQRFKSLPDYLQIWPGHGAGSACGKALGAVPSSTLGYERFANWGLTAETEEAFVAMVLAGQPEPPRYFAEMKRVNRAGPALLGGFATPPVLGADHLARALAEGLIVDTRGTAAFAKGHVPGSYNVPLGGSFTTYGGQILPFDTPLWLLVNDTDGPQTADAVRALAMIGYDRVEGVFGRGVLDGANGKLGTMPQIAPKDAAPKVAAGEVVLVDVRKGSEYDEGHIGGARRLPLAELVARADELPKDADLVMQCESGSRSAVAASVLRARGFRRVTNLTGGLNAWKAAGLPVGG